MELEACLEVLFGLARASSFRALFEVEVTPRDKHTEGAYDYQKRVDTAVRKAMVQYLARHLELDS